MNQRFVIAVLLCGVAGYAVYHDAWLLAFFIAWMAAELREEKDI